MIANRSGMASAFHLPLVQACSLNLKLFGSICLPEQGQAGKI
jgi:hypothetical protein